MFLKNVDHSNLRKSLTPYIRQSSKFGINFFLKFIMPILYDVLINKKIIDER